MYHPACWVRNDGCITNTPHHKAPLAQAYSSVHMAAGPMDNPGEGTRVRDPGRIPVSQRERFAAQAPAERPRPVVRRAAPEPMIGEPDERDAPIIDAAGPPRYDSPPAGRPVPPRRYQDAIEGSGSRKPLPKVYGGHGILDYWYVPVAIVMAVAVALGVIFLADRIFGSGGGDPAPADATQTAAATQPGGAASSTTPQSTATLPPASPTAQGTFQAGDVVVVIGSEPCLNVRPAPGLDAGNEPIACVVDGSLLTITGGPQQAGGLQWWNVETAEGGQGWAAEDYLERQP